jgi:uncharacterized LabA/DUF88 family protein
MANELPRRPGILRVVVFVDGQNFYNDCRKVFGHGEAHPHLLGREVCSSRLGEGRVLKQVRFYTGIHSPDRKPRMHAYMTRRLETMSANGVWTFSRPLKYSMQWIRKDDECIEVMKGREKGIDVKLALDLYVLAQKGEYDIATVVSTDTDLDEAIREVIDFREETGIWLAVENAVCVKPTDPKTGKRPPYKRLKSAGRIIHLDEEIFEKIRDDTNYLP